MEPFEDVEIRITYSEERKDSSVFSLWFLYNLRAFYLKSRVIY